MKITPPPDLETIVRKRMHAIGCDDAGEVVRDALLRLQRQEEQKQKEARLRQAIQEADDDFAHGRFITLKNDKEMKDFFNSLKQAG